MSEEYTNVGTEGHCDYEQPELTQEIVNEEADKIRAYWDDKVSESGLSQSMFIATDKTGFVSEFLYFCQRAKQGVEDYGLVMPTIVEGVKVNDSVDGWYSQEQKDAFLGGEGE